MPPNEQEGIVLRSGKTVSKQVTLAKTKGLEAASKKLKAANDQYSKKIFGKNVDKSA